MQIKQLRQKYMYRTLPDNKLSFHLDSLYSTLIELKPKYCLEIGTNYGNSTRVFQDYFNEYMPDGRLITLDIKLYADLSELKNVTPLIVHPYDDSVTKWHVVTEGELLPGFKEWDRALIKNIGLVQTTGLEFDFVFIDGDHFRQSLLNDIELSLQVTKAPHYMLIDDTDDPRHDSAKVFYDELVPSQEWETYDFNDWNIRTGTGLIWKQ